MQKEKMERKQFELHPGRHVGSDNPCYVIAEIGQNHQGDESIATELIRIAASIGCDCVKFQRCCLKSKFNQKALDRPYNSKHSFGSTYGAHKACLQLTDEQFFRLKNYSLNNQGIQFTASAMDTESIDFLMDRMQVPWLKIGSGDVDNFPLIEKAADKNVPLVISTGMHGIDVIKRSINLASKFNDRICVLQCTSSYPCPPRDVHLNCISLYQQIFPDKVIGYSGHERSWPISLGAVAKGAKVLERHLTLDHTMKGADHECSLEPEEFKLLIDNVKILEEALGRPVKSRQPSEEECFQKLGKSIVARRNLKSGCILVAEDLAIKVAEPHGIAAHKMDEVIGRIVRKDIHQDESINEQDLIIEN
ncbi:N-acetylneuraminic acid synthase [Brevipalpus obovatus]|uniref:N-acetylneuraminic acid synthase n=1 Tax=Brevipalpus obovatus TaxID=246614 RepID=UPI003D9DFCF2